MCHAGAQAECIEWANGKCSVTALGTTGMADEVFSAASCAVCEGGIDKFEKMGVLVEDEGDLLGRGHSYLGGNDKWNAVCGARSYEFDGDYRDVVYLAEVASGFRDFGGALGAEFLSAIETEELPAAVLGFNDTIGDEGEAVAGL